MGLASNTSKNLLPNGRGYLLFKKTGETGQYDFGETPKFEFTPHVKEEMVYSSRAGVKEIIDQYQSEKGATAEFEIIEYSVESLAMLQFASGVAAASQIAAQLDAVSKTVIGGRYIDLGKMKLSYFKITHGTVTNGPFDVGETVTGGTSTKTAKVAWVGSGYLACINQSGAFALNETITGGTSAATATVTALENPSDVILLDHATIPTKRYVLGTDYELLSLAGRLFAPKTGGGITLTNNEAAVYVSADAAGMAYEEISPLTEAYLEGELEFLGNPDRGPVIRTIGWKCRLTISGAIGLIADGHKPLGVKVEYLADRSGHPDCPYYKTTFLENR
jgi:hypothetical protein